MKSLCGGRLIPPTPLRRQIECEVVGLVRGEDPSMREILMLLNSFGVKSGTDSGALLCQASHPDFRGVVFSGVLKGHQNRLQEADRIREDSKRLLPFAEAAKEKSRQRLQDAIREFQIAKASCLMDLTAGLN
jgi:hypothetical protein